MALIASDKLSMLTSILNGQEIFFLKVNLSGELTFVNPYYADYLGYTPDQMLGKNVADYLLPAYKEVLHRATADCLRNLDQSQKILLKKQHASGQILTSQWEFIAASDHMGKPLEIYCIGHDITQESDNLQIFQRLVHHMGDSVLKMTADGRFTYVSPQWVAKYGHTEAETIGKPFQDFIHPQDLPEALAKVGKLIATGESPEAMEHRIKHKDGTWLWVETKGSLNPYTQEIILITRDISKSKVQMGQLKFQAKMLEAVSQSVIFLDNDWRIKYWNKGAERMFGWKEEEVLDAILPRGTLTGDMTSEEGGIIMEKLQRGESWEGEFLLKHKDGMQFLALVSNNPVLDDKGNVIGYVGISTDITHVKRTEEDLLRNQQQMKLAIDTAKLGIWELHLESGVLEWNDELLRIYELTRAEFEQDIQGFRKRVFPEDLAIADRELQK
ncbi:MAG: PAS domain S-box protein, partial [Bacteroidota bacterium]